MIDNLILLLDHPIALVDLAVNGLMIGAIFVLVAYGMALVWGVMNIINICQGEFVILGGFIAIYTASLGISPFFAVPGAFVLLYLGGGALSRTSVDRFFFGTRRRGLLTLTGGTVLGIIVWHAFDVPMSAFGRLDYLSLDGSWFAVAVSALVNVLYWIWNMIHVVLDSLVIGFILASPVMFVLAGGLFGIVIRHIVDRDLFTSILATFGISIFIQQVMNEIFTADVVIARHGLDTWSLFGGGITIEQVKLATSVLAVVIGFLLVFYMRSTRSGQAIRATAQNARAARIMGIDTDMVYARTYALNAAICGSAGALVAMIFTIQAYGGLAYTIRGFLVVIAAGLGNLGGVIVAGLSLGAAETVAGFVLGSEFQIAFVFGMLVLIVVYRQIRLSFQRKYLV